MTQTGDVRFQSHEELIRRLEEAETWEKMRHEQVKRLIDALEDCKVIAASSTINEPVWALPNKIQARVDAALKDYK